LRLVKYDDSMYTDVAKFVKDEIDFGIMPRKLGGHGLVMLERVNIIGFIWGITAPDSEVVCIEYFGIERRRRGNGVHGFLLMMRFVADMYKAGKTKIIGYMNDDAEYSDMMARMCNSSGMEIRKGYIVTGNSATILENMKKRVTK